MFSFLDKRLYEIYEKIESGKRLGTDDGLVLYQSNDLIGIGHLADYVRRNRHDNKAYLSLIHI